jgi:hypothetical protein
MRNAALLLAFGLLAVAHFSCTELKVNGAGAATGETYYSVAVNSADFFHYGPQQDTGPDQRLPRDTLMRVTGRSFGYAKVKLMDGKAGYVASDDIHEAPASLVAAAFPTPTPARRVYPEPQLPPLEPEQDVEPTPIPSPSADH